MDEDWAKAFESLPSGRWLKIHQQKPDDNIHFARQAYAGSGFDQQRSRLMLFGSDTHSENLNNTIYSFDLNTIQWTKAYSPDSPETYKVNSDGIPVAGIKAGHPWAMRTFGALAYDTLRDELVVASAPDYKGSNKYGQPPVSIWTSIKNHPTWVYNTLKNKWDRYKGKSIQFTPYAVTYDIDRGVVTGFLPNGIFDWDGLVNGWTKIGDRVYGQYHTNVVYDSVNHVFILYGGNALKNSVHVYVVGDKSSKEMLTIGLRPPAGQSIPLAFHKKLGKVVALIDTGGYAQTWLYDYASDQWQRVNGADFPYSIGMNYSMEYDIRYNVIVLVSSPKNGETAVWVIRL